jgi:hypothetical protein
MRSITFKFSKTFLSNEWYKLIRETQTSNILQKPGMAGNVMTNFIRNDIAVLVSCNDNLCRATNAIINRQHMEILKLSTDGSQNIYSFF